MCRGSMSLAQSENDLDLTEELDLRWAAANVHVRDPQLHAERGASMCTSDYHLARE